MEKGISKHWTPEKEAHFQRMLNAPLSFAERYMITSIRNLLKYDGRTRESKRAAARLRLTLATATDEEVAELEALQKEMLGEEGYSELMNSVGSDRDLRDKIRAEGIPRTLIARGKDA